MASDDNGTKHGTLTRLPHDTFGFTWEDVDRHRYEAALARDSEELVSREFADPESPFRKYYSAGNLLNFARSSMRWHEDMARKIAELLTRAGHQRP